MLGSRDGINWTLVFKYAGSPSGASSTYTVSATQGYNYYRLVVGSVVSANATNMYTYVLNGTEEALCVSNDSKVGVGIANPQRALEIAGDLVTGGTVSAGNPLMYRNRIINGDMRIAQRGTSNVLVNPTNLFYYGTIDRWKTVAQWSSGQLTTTQQTLASSDTPYQVGFRNSVRYTATSALTGFSFFYALQAVELVNVVDFNLGLPYGSPFTVSFWFRSNIPAGSVMCAAVQTYITVQMSYVTEFKTTGTWQYVTFTVPPMTTAQGALTTDNFNLAIGSLYPGGNNSTPSSNVNTWQNGINSFGSAAMYNWWNNAGNYIEFTGVQLEKGTVATPFEVRPYATELQLCQRYYEVGPRSGTWYATSVSAGRAIGRFIVPKRAAPTVTLNSGNIYGVTPTASFNSGNNVLMGTIGSTQYNGPSTDSFTTDYTNSSNNPGGPVPVGNAPLDVFVTSGGLWTANAEL